MHLDLLPAWGLLEVGGYPRMVPGTPGRGIPGHSYALAEPWETPLMSGSAPLETTDMVTEVVGQTKKRNHSAPAWGGRVGSHPGRRTCLLLPQGPLPQTSGPPTQTTQFWCEDRGLPVV